MQFDSAQSGILPEPIGGGPCHGRLHDFVLGLSQSLHIGIIYLSINVHFYYIVYILLPTRLGTLHHAPSPELSPSPLSTTHLPLLPPLSISLVTPAI